MRRFDDDQGRRWDVVVGRESWGALYAIFVPSGEGEVRQTLLRATGREEAHRELDAMDDAGLQDLLERSEPKST